MTSSTSTSKPCVFIVGLKPNEHALKTIERWRDKGYDDRSVWNGFEAAVARHIERNFAITCLRTHHQVPELYSQMEQMLPSLLTNFNLLAITGRANLDNYIIRIRVLAWRVVIELEEFLY